jgi:hypothetical protein
MGQIGTLLTGAGVTTTISGQAQTDQYLLLGDVDTPNPLQGIQVEVDGTTFFNIQSAVLITAAMKWLMETAGAGVIGLLLKVATGSIKRTTTYRFTNSGATVPAIFAFSEQGAGGGLPVVAGTKGINAVSYDDFSQFSALMVDLPANVSTWEIVFTDGTKSTLTTVEVDALFALSNQTEANGKLGTVTVLDNTARNIATVRINTTAAVTVLILKLPQAAFDALNS